MILNFNTKNRKFHDAWALIFFILFTITGIGALLMYSKTEDYFLVIRGIPLSVLILASFSVFFQFIILLAALLYLPGPLMHCSFFVLPAIGLIMSIVFYNPIGLFMSILGAVVSLVAYFFYFKDQIQYAKVICQKVSEKINQSLFLLFSYTFGTTLLFSTFIYFLIQTTIGLPVQQMEKNIIYFLFCLFYFWVIFNTLYAVRVLFSSIIFCRTIAGSSVHVESRNIEGSNVRSNQLSNSEINQISFNNLMFSLGSVCFGGLLIAIVSALESLHDRNSRSDRNGGGPGILNVIIACFLAILREILDYSNQWVFVWIALTGDSYIKGTKNAWHTLFECYGIVDNHLVERVVGMISFFFTLAFVVVLGALVKDDVLKFYQAGPGGDNQKFIEFVLGLVFIITVYIYNITIVYSMFETGVKAVTFSYTLFPDIIRKNDIDLANALDRKKEYVTRR